MNNSNNHQLEFFIKLTGIIGRTFSDLQQLLTSELRRQQSQISNKPTINESQNNFKQPIENKSPHLIKTSQLPVIRKEKRKSSESQQPYHPKESKKKQKLIKKYKKLKIKASYTKYKLKGSQKQKYQKKKKLKAKKKTKQVGKPMPPLNAFMLFLKEKKNEIMTKKPQLSPSQVSIYASTIWNGFNDTQKQQYLQIYRKNHQIYLQQVRKFREQEKQGKEGEEAKQFKQKNKKNQQQQREEENKKPQLSQPLKINLRSNLRHRIQRKRRLQKNEIINIDSQIGSQNEENGANSEQK